MRQTSLVMQRDDFKLFLKDWLNAAQNLQKKRVGDLCPVVGNSRLIIIIILLLLLRKAQEGKLPASSQSKLRRQCSISLTAPEQVNNLFNRVTASKFQTKKLSSGNFSSKKNCLLKLTENTQNRSCPISAQFRRHVMQSH